MTKRERRLWIRGAEFLRLAIPLSFQWVPGAYDMETAPKRLRRYRETRHPAYVRADSVYRSGSTRSEQLHDDLWHQKFGPVALENCARICESLAYDNTDGPR